MTWWFIPFISFILAPLISYFIYRSSWTINWNRIIKTAVSFIIFYSLFASQTLLIPEAKEIVMRFHEHFNNKPSWLIFCILFIIGGFLACAYYGITRMIFKDSIKSKVPHLVNSIDKASKQILPINFKTVQPAQFLPDKQGGVYIVMPDIQITNIDNVATVVNVELLIKKDIGHFINFQPSATRIREIELWLDGNHAANSNFLGRQINVSPNSGINGYMCFYVDKFNLDMSSLTVDRLPYLPHLFRIEQIGLKPRDISQGEAITGAASQHRTLVEWDCDQVGAGPCACPFSEYIDYNQT